MSSLALIEELNPEHQPVELVQVGPGAMQLLLDLEQSGALTPRALDLPAEIDYDRFESLGAFLGELKSRGNFYLGDWLIFGEATYGERFAQASEATGLSEQTLLRVMTVCRKVPASRRNACSWSVHAAVSNLPAREQKSWLAKALAGGWGYAELRKHLQAARTEERPQMFDGDGPAHEPDPDRLLEVAKLIATSAEIAGENVIIRHDYYVQLRAALGMEE